MVTTPKTLALLSAVMAAALVIAVDTIAPRAEPSAVNQVAHRFPLTTETFTPVPLTSFVLKKFISAQKEVTVEKTRRPPASQFCATTPHGWPYTSHECRVAAGAVSLMHA